MLVSTIESGSLKLVYVYKGMLVKATFGLLTK